MKILLDLQGCQSASRMRGIGRYCLSLAEALIRNAPQHEVWILLSDLFPETVMPLRKHFAALLPASRIAVFSAPSPVAEGDPDNLDRARAAEWIREHAISAIAPDVVHVGSLFEGFVDDAVTSIAALNDGPPTAVTLYDLIPLRNPATYLTNPFYRTHYQRKIESLKRADLLLAISASAANEAVESLALTPERVRIIHAAIDDAFTPGDSSFSTPDDLLQRLDLRRPFAMHIGVIEPRKHFEGLIRAWALLPAQTRQAHQLLLVAQGPDAERERLRRLARSVGLADDEIRVTGHVSDADLIALYRSCRLFAFPSLHEGFGLPVLEAMACGAVVVASNTSSLPEVVGLDEALFNPNDDWDIATRIAHGLDDEQFRAGFREHAALQCRRFSWDETARHTLAALESIATRRRAPTSADNYSTLISKIGAKRWNEAEATSLAQTIAANQRPPSPKQLFVDISELAERDARTGIQRVVRAVLQDLLKSPPYGYHIEPVRFDRDSARYRYARRYLAARNSDSGTSEDSLVEAWPGDLFLGLDLTADRLPLAVPWLAAQRRRGISVAFVVYDTLPLRHPEWWPAGTGAMFERWAELIAQVSDQVVCISRAVADDYACWLGEHGIAPPKLCWFHLGADVANTAPSGGMPDGAADTLDAIRRAPAFLMVGTLEPRKGHQQALSAFELLWAEGVSCNLVIVGKAGWMIDPLLERLRAHPLRGTRLFWIEGASDEYLEALYQAADVLLAPSEGEGFGLPLIEGAQHGLPILARDLPVFREVAGEHARYFSGITAAALAAAVKQALPPHLPPTSSKLRWLTWHESVQQLLCALGFSPTSDKSPSNDMPDTQASPQPADPRHVGLSDAVRAGWYRQSTNELLQGFPISADDTVLDVGCGAGMASLFAGQRGARVISADVDASAITALEQRMASSAARCWQGIVGDSNPLPLGDGIATRVIAMEMLEHVADPVVVMREFARVAAPGALLLFAVPDAASEALQRTVAPASYFQHPNHVRILSAEDFEALVTNAGLVIERRHSYSFYWNMAMALFWLSGKGVTRPEGAPAMSFLQPPFPPVVEQWAQVWSFVLNHPEGEALRAHLDATMPKTQILIARKPAG
ncbi:glycosyltransferase [Niveibacterium sp.]|uniref:glycosyltransferase n=1 Tax=Niveibacterium sp. TaxID=2017444 RepID=UPI0035B04797